MSTGSQTCEMARYSSSTGVLSSQRRKVRHRGWRFPHRPGHSVDGNLEQVVRSNTVNCKVTSSTLRSVLDCAESTPRCPCGRHFHWTTRSDVRTSGVPLTTSTVCFCICGTGTSMISSTVRCWMCSYNINLATSTISSQTSCSTLRSEMRSWE